MATAVAPPTEAIDRRVELAYRVFAAGYLTPLRPVVIAGAIEKWAALGKWTPRFFRDTYPDKPLPVEGKIYRLAEFIDIVEQSTDEQPAPYLFALLIDEHFPELLPDIAPWPSYMTPNWLARPCLPGNVGRTLYNDRRPALFIGGRGGFCKLHFDVQYHSFSFQLFGEKTFYLYSPDQAPLMYASPEHRYLSQVSVERPDFDKFPRFAEARPMTCKLRAGETLFIPGGWWHTTRMLSPSVSVSVNTANGANWPAIVRDICGNLRAKHPLLARPYGVALRTFGAVRAAVDAWRC